MNGLKAFVQVLKDPLRKSLPRVLKEILAFGIRNKENPTRYVNNMLYRKAAGDPMMYISKREAIQIHRYQRDPAIGQFFGNKVLSYLHLQNTDVRMPRVLGYNVGSCFMSGQNCRSIASSGEFCRLLEDMLRESPRIFMKPATGAGGGGIIEFSSEALGRLDMEGDI